MMKKTWKLILLGMICLFTLAACSNKKNASETETTPETETALQTGTQTVVPEETEELTKAPETDIVISDGTAIRIGSLKGPTSMGLVHLMDLSDKDESNQNYTFDMVTAADELTAKIINQEVDIAMVPANVASVLYNKTNGGVKVLNINTLGVLYIVENGSQIKSIADLKGKTLYLTGKGTTPDYVLAYLLAQNGLTTDDVKLEYKSEPTEVAALLAEEEGAVGLLPQPFVTVALNQNENLKIALDLTQEWNQVAGDQGSSLVTGVTIVRTDFLKDEAALVATFLEEYQASIAYTNEHPTEAAVLIEELGIVAKAAIAEQAIPLCNITDITKAEMKEALSGYLKVLYDQNPQSVGGTLPGDDFYISGNFYEIP